MTGQGQTYTEILDASGPTHTGSGDQYNSIRMTVINQARYRRTATGLWSRTHLEWLELRFVEPDGFDRASEALDARNAVILRDSPGSGRRTAAMMLLTKGTGNRGRGTRFRELFPVKAEGDQGDAAWDAAELVEEDDRLLLDLTSVHEEGHAQVSKGLMEFRGVVETRGAFLVIIAHDEHELSDGTAGLDCHLRPPGRADVLARHLGVDGLKEPVGSLLAQPDRLARLGTWPMGRVARLAELTLAAREANPAARGEAWLDSAFTALTDDGKAIAERVSGLQEAPQRALLLAAALLSGMTADAAAAAATDLLATLEYRLEPGEVLDPPDLVERLEQVGARIDADRKIRFTQLAQDSAALVYYWDAFPGLRPYLVDWLDRVVRHEALTAPERDEVVSRFATQSLRTDRIQDLETLITRWTAGGSDTQKLKLFHHAATLLDTGLGSGTHGPYFRRWIYDRSTTNSPIRLELAAVLIEACLGQLAETHPEQALVRLHHIARSKGQAGELGRDALAGFVAEDDRRLRRLLYRIANPSGAPNPDDAEVFLRIADPDRLTDHARRVRPLITFTQIRGQLVAGWGLVLSRSASRAAQARVADWLRAAALGRERDRILGVLIDAASDFSAASRLEAAACTWAAATPSDEAPATPGPAHRVALVRRLLSDLDRRHRVEPRPFATYREPGRPSTPPTSEAFQ